MHVRAVSVYRVDDSVESFVGACLQICPHSAISTDTNGTDN